MPPTSSPSGHLSGLALGSLSKKRFLFKFKHRWKDWTAGCIAVTNDEIEEIYAAVKDGTPITIKP